MRSFGRLLIFLIISAPEITNAKPPQNLTLAVDFVNIRKFCIQNISNTFSFIALSTFYLKLNFFKLFTKF